MKKVLVGEQGVHFGAWIEGEIGDLIGVQSIAGEVDWILRWGGQRIDNLAVFVVAFLWICGLAFVFLKIRVE